MLNKFVQNEQKFKISTLKFLKNHRKTEINFKALLGDLCFEINFLLIICRGILFLSLANMPVCFPILFPSILVPMWLLVYLNGNVYLFLFKLLLYTFRNNCTP